MSVHFSFAAMGLLVLGAVESAAQHADIAIYQDAAGRLTTHDANASAQPRLGTFARSFDFFGPPFGIYAGDDPGIQMSGLSPPPGSLALPGSAELGLNLVPLHLPGQAIGNLLYWDGAGPDIEFTSVPAQHTLTLEDATGVTEVALDGSLARFQGLVAGVTDPQGGMHEHLTYVLEDHDGTAATSPATGLYLMAWQFTMPALQSSDYTLIVLASPDVSTASRAQVTSWLESRRDSTRIAGDFDGNGRYECEDVDALVLAIVSQQPLEAFDLNLDGRLDLLDLHVWRGLAGEQLLGSGRSLLVGDANLDGAVDGSDFGIWNSQKFTPQAAWCRGDFNADGAIDGSDFGSWNENKFQSSAGRQAVPEPVPLPGGLAVLAYLFFFREQPWSVAD